MAFVSEIFDQLRDLMTDITDSQASYLTKRLYVNRAIARLWPHIYSVKTLDIALTAGTYEYALPVAVMDGHVLSLQVNTLTDTARYYRFNDYDVVPGDEDLAGKLVVGSNPSTGTTLRIRYVAPVPIVAALTYAASQSEVWTGPDRALQLPALYAMGMLTIRKLDDRQDTNRYSTTQATNGVTDQDIMAASQMWFAQFEMELNDMTRPLPPARD